MTTPQRLGLAAAVLAILVLAVVTWRDGSAPDAPVLARARAHPAADRPPPQPEPSRDPSPAEVADFERRVPK
jgi:hypothetical protein